MIKFEYNGDCYFIDFYYLDLWRDAKYRGGVKCSLYKNGYNRLSTGESFCLKEDNFSKETGRQISLEKAIKNLKLDIFFSKQSEGLFYAILDAYWNRSESTAMKRKSFSELREIRRKADVRKKIRMLERELKGLKKSIGGEVR